MMRLGLHLTLQSGRSALTRLLATIAAVAVGVALLLSVAALYNGYETTINRACWACVGRPGGGIDARADGPQTPSLTPADNAELWSYSEDFYQGRIIERADVAALGPHAPVVPGVPGVPKAGEYYASPALARLIASVPQDELGDRFPGTLVGEIGPAGLSGPDDLAIVVGHTPADLATPVARRITSIPDTPQRRGDTTMYRFGFALGAVALLVPLLVLIGNATRLAAARREERYAAMRLVGATPRQVNVIASVDAVIGALLGTVVGIGISLLLRPLAAGISITGSRFFLEYVTPTALEYAAVLVGVPMAAGLVAVLALRRVNISPLGVARRVTRRGPRAWRVLPLVAGLVVFIVPLSLGNPQQADAGLAALGLALIMVGLVIGGGWLTMHTAYALSRLRPGPASLLAARRMADDPRSTFRSVSGLVLAVFVGTLVAGVVPGALAAQQTPSATSLDPVMRVFLHGSVEQTAAAPGGLIDQLRALTRVAVLPVRRQEPNGAAAINPDQGPPPGVISCSDLAAFSALGHCPPGRSVTADASAMTTDNLAYLDQQLPLVTPNSRPYTGDASALPVNLVLINVDSSAALERIRTFLTVHYPGLTEGTGSAPLTFGEVAAVRGALYTELGNVVLLVVGLTLLVAGASLAIAVGGGVIDRRRPFTLLRVSGTPSAVLRRVVMLEALLPLLSATIVAGVVGLATSIPVNLVLNPDPGGSTLHLPDGTYYATLAAGLLISIAVIAATLPIINRVTGPDSVRFE